MKKEKAERQWRRK